jgi:hypothetical protein
MTSQRETVAFYQPVILMCPSSSRRMLKERERKLRLQETSSTLLAELRLTLQAAGAASPSTAELSW